MKKWIIIDDCTSTRAAIFETVLGAKTQEEAESAARLEWDRLTKRDKDDRDAFFVGLCEITPEIEDGSAYYTDNMTNIIEIK